MYSSALNTALCATAGVAFPQHVAPVKINVLPYSACGISVYVPVTLLPKSVTELLVNCDQHVMNVQTADCNVHTNCYGCHIHKNTPWHIFSCPSLTEEYVETVITTPPVKCGRIASGHRAEYRVQGSTVPNMHCQSALHLGRHGWRYTHAGTHKYCIHNTSQQHHLVTDLFHTAESFCRI
jgi:hypothetical protein